MTGCIRLDPDEPEDLTITLVIAALIIAFIIFQFRKWASRIIASLTTTKPYWPTHSKRLPTSYEVFSSVE